MTIMAPLHCKGWFLCWKTLPSFLMTLQPSSCKWALHCLYPMPLPPVSTSPLVPPTFCYNLLDYIVLFTYVFAIKLRTSQEQNQ